MRKDSEQQAAELLQVASNILLQTFKTRQDQLAVSVRLLATDFGFRQAVATAEEETIQSVLENHGARIEADLAFLFSPEGRLMASTAAAADAELFDILLQQAQTQPQGQVQLVAVSKQAYQLIFVPVRAPHIIAWVGMGFRINGQLAEQLQALTLLQLSFAVRRSAEWNIVTSTLPENGLWQFVEYTKMNSQLTGVQSLHDIPVNYTSKAFPIDAAQQVWAILHLPNERWLSNYLALRSQLIQIFGLGLALVLIVAFFYTRSIVQPIARLISFARGIGQGRVEVPPLVKLAEINMLANTLVQMQGNLKRREQQLVDMTLQDSLTQLGNRLAVDKKLPALLADQGNFLLQLNIAKFRLVNDSLGFKNGDTLLQQLANRIQQLPELLFCARLEADQFLLVLPASQQSSEVLTGVLQSLSQPFDLSGSKIQLRLIAGIYCPESDLDPNTTLRRLEIALNNARQADSDLAFYRQGQDEQYQRELQIIHDLPGALQSGQLTLVYQPKVDIGKQYCAAAEALVRWQHPRLGFISPVEFILLAERTGNISMISEWVLKKVIEQLADWRTEHPDLTIAVNLSAADFIDSTLPERILDFLTQAQVPLSALTLELTESAVMQDKHLVLTTLNRLKQAGIKLAIDDFGTGQSSLAYLKDLPVDEVKIDRAFIKDIENNHHDILIVKATAELAAGLNLKVTAEGLENPAGLIKIKQAGCQLVQGYYFAKPLAAVEFSRWRKNFNNDPSTYFVTLAKDPAIAQAVVV